MGDVKREKLAKELIKILFTEEERISMNCNGINKPKLDPVRMDAVKEAVFDIQMCPLSERRAAWKKCVTVIDSFDRDFKRRKEKEAKSKQSETDKSS